MKERNVELTLLTTSTPGFQRWCNPKPSISAMYIIPSTCDSNCIMMVIHAKQIRLTCIIQLLQLHTVYILASATFSGSASMRPETNFMTLLTVSKQSALRQAENSVVTSSVFQRLAVNFRF